MFLSAVQLQQPRRPPPPTSVSCQTRELPSSFKRPYCVSFVFFGRRPPRRLRHDQNRVRNQDAIEASRGDVAAVGAARFHCSFEQLLEHPRGDRLMEAVCEVGVGRGWGEGGGGRRAPQSAKRKSSGLQAPPPPPPRFESACQRPDDCWLLLRLRLN